MWSFDMGVNKIFPPPPELHLLHHLTMVRNLSIRFLRSQKFVGWFNGAWSNILVTVPMVLAHKAGIPETLLCMPFVLSAASLSLQMAESLSPAIPQCMQKVVAKT
ncbi:hypothetical protein ACJMK2_028836 [Sinanodonta woodiana]|uniref:Uncharacterized protein n=1 Tax=Sinanodonta woodiana TaxID=1069815 RepID=A0ABD3X8B3_SINWO